VASDFGPTEASLNWYTQSIATLERILARMRSHALARECLFKAYKGRFLVFRALGRNQEALHDLEREMELVPSGAARDLVRLDRAKTLAKLKRHTEAVAEARELLASPGIDVRRLLIVATIYSWAFSAAKDDDPGLAEEYAIQAVDLVRRAIAEGFNDVTVLQTDDDFAALRQRPDFQKLLNDL
jgi:tetratricopeptide (TPR) repeat protein